MQKEEEKSLNLAILYERLKAKTLLQEKIESLKEIKVFLYFQTSRIFQKATLVNSHQIF